MTSLNKYLVVGATGGTGKALVNSLLSEGKKVAILVRNKTHARAILKENYEKIDRIIEVELGLSQLKALNEPEYNSELLEVLEWCEAVISCLGVKFNGDPQKSDYMSIVELLQHCKKSRNFQNKKFVYVSTMYITRPYTFVAFLLNSLMSSVMGWKALAENRIRDSGLNYLIVRPGRLTDSEVKKCVLVTQGDSIKGEISRNNLVNMIIHSIGNSNIDMGKVTCEVTETTEAGILKLPPQIMMTDDDSSYITADHFRATRNLTVISWFFLTCLFLWIIFRFK